MPNKNILLIEPGYKNKYPPLGLMKIAHYHGQNGKKDRVRYIKGCDRSVLDQAWDRIYITTLFSFEWKRISEAIDFAIEASGNQPNNVFVGGIAASLMHQAFLDEPRWHGVRFIKGLLNKPAAISLQLDSFSEELYSEDQFDHIIEDAIPDYGILDQVAYKYPVHDAYFAYASRGCVRKCSFCGVPKLEGDLYDTPSLTKIVKEIERLYGPKKDLVLMDNNIVASPRFKDIIAEIRDLGFQAGATLIRGKSKVQRRVDFNQGVDARILCKDAMFLREMATICIKPLRIAFDHLGLKKPYEQSIRFARDSGLRDLSNYMLYNFHDTPRDLYERMWLNIMLNEELDIRIFSFPMRYQPTDMKDRSHIGEHWTKYSLRSMQVILHATHGIVSGSPGFFKRAFGSTAEEFQTLVLRPHKFIFHRVWFEELGGKAEFEEYQKQIKSFSGHDHAELLVLLKDFENKHYENICQQASSKKVGQLLRFYKPLTHQEEGDIRARHRRQAERAPVVPDDERVEDAGLELEPHLETNSLC